MMNKTLKISPPRLLVLVFAFFIGVGTILLKLPIATEHSISWIDALFTTTSAMTVTGLNVVDPGSTYTLFGEIVIMCLIQLGGLGIMSFAVLIYFMLGRKIGFQERLVMQHALNQTSLGGVIRLVRNLFIYSFAIEGCAVILLSIRFVPEYGLAKGLYYSLFHSVSAFNNAGFALWEDNLMGFVGDPVINLVISLLFIIGGIGFTVLIDLKRAKRFRDLSLHSKLMIISTIAVNIASMIIIFLLEYNNPNTLGPLTSWEKFWATYFQAVSPRTAGFNTVDLSGLEDPTAFFMTLLMFVGAGSASTGGGIKLTTFIIFILAVTTFIRGKNAIVVFRKTIADTFVIKALAITMISILFIFIAIFFLTITENQPFIKLAFEVLSAFGTVGLTMGLTGDLSEIGKLIIIFIMFLGKLGPLTLVFSFARHQKEQKVRYPKEDILTG
ncbi:TrkH family potassium uptake protein [Bacillus sp. JJ1503]|uniref:TrkH family potassium uptake protein n=1 Tax=unclassified Bacillus (in: firmicutes) TaxID=185979 RepID=UPI003000A013